MYKSARTLCADILEELSNPLHDDGLLFANAATLRWVQDREIRLDHAAPGQLACDVTVDYEEMVGSLLLRVSELEDALSASDGRLLDVLKMVGASRATKLKKDLVDSDLATKEELK